MRPVPSLSVPFLPTQPIASPPFTKQQKATKPKPPTPQIQLHGQNPATSARASMSSSCSSNDVGDGDGADPPRSPSGARGDLGPVLEDTPPRLRFTVGPCPQGFPLSEAPGFIASIDYALARHADAQVDSLEISLVFRAPFQFYMASFRQYATDHPHAALVKAHHVRAWLRYGMARAAHSFVLEVPPCDPPPTTTIDRLGSSAAEAENEGMDLELPASAAAATMALTLANATLTLPAPAEASFHALTNLILANARIVDGVRLGELLSSPAFPRLRRLRLMHLVGVAELHLCVGELEELAIVGARDLRFLVVDAPRLRTLRVTDRTSLESGKGEMAIHAPELEVLTCANMCKLQDLRFDARSVREIGELPLWTHGHADHVARNKASICIINHCTAAHSLHLHLHVPQIMRGYLVSEIAANSGMVDYASILVDEIPELPNITALTVTIPAWSGHSYAASLARLIAQCVNLEELHIDVQRQSATAKPACSDQACVCNNEGGWENQNFSLERLRYLEIAGGWGLDYEKRLAEMILAGAPANLKFKLPR